MTERTQHTGWWLTGVYVVLALMAFLFAKSYIANTNDYSAHVCEVTLCDAK